MAIQTLFRFL